MYVSCDAAKLDIGLVIGSSAGHRSARVLRLILVHYDDRRTDVIVEMRYDECVVLCQIGLSLVSCLPLYSGNKHTWGIREKGSYRITDVDEQR